MAAVHARSVLDGPAPDGSRRARTRSLVRDAIILLVAVIALTVNSVTGEIDNPDRPPAVALTARLEQLYRDVRAGDITLPPVAATVATGIRGVRYDRGEAGLRWMVAGEAGRDCYLLWWDEAGVRRVRTLPPTEPCEPSTDALSSRPGSFGRIGQAAGEDEPTAAWETVLPAARRHRVWFVPVWIIGIGVGLSALVRISIALITGRPPSAVRN